MKVSQETRSWNDLFAVRTRSGVGEGLAAILALAGNTEIISFAGGFPDPQTFPGERAATLMQELVSGGDVSALQYAPTQGLPGPLDALATRLEVLQGHGPAADELMVTSGAIEALELVGKSFIDPGDDVVVEGPTYLGAIMAFRSFEAKVVAVAMDEHGLQVDELEQRLDRGLRPKLLYTIPDHQNPAGVSLSLERRQTLVELARHHGFLVVEDVAYRELGFRDDPLPSLWSLAPDVVVQAGTTSKTFFPGVRLGWAAGPSEVVAQLVAAKQNTDQCAGSLGQRLFEEYVRRGWIDEQLTQSRALYQRRCERMMSALERFMSPSATWTKPEGGFFSWLRLPEGIDAIGLAQRALKSGVAVVPGDPFFPDGRGSNNVRLSFSRVDDELIDEGIQRLAALITSEDKGRST
ncbi:MAG: PLP-dependent aminotransferase family protein [Actinobacteria bacterium]|nr:PLP-dependent aminotransferase family protein [Actinomycetota bacterium]